MEMEEFDAAGCAKVWLWGNRLFALLAILFEALFSLDSFWGERPLEEKLLAFAMHNIPTYFLLAILAVAWRWEWLGGILFFLAGVSFFIIFGPAGGVVGMPLIIAALLFLLRWYFIEGPGRPSEAV